jgi:adenosylcobinamide-GDP ribazoletransferase
MWAVTALIAGHALSRWCAVLTVWRLPYARADSSARARPVVERVSGADIVVATVFGLAPLAAAVALALLDSPGAIGGVALLLGALAAMMSTALLGLWYARRLGGYTGDTLGATQQITEVTFYLAMLAAWNLR